MMDVRTYKRFFSGLGFRMVACSLVINAMQIVFRVLLMQAGVDIQRDYNIEFAVAMIPTYLIGYPVSYLIIGDGNDKRAIEKRRMKPSHFFIAFLIGYALMMIGNIIGMIVTYGIGVIKGEPVTNALQDIVMDSNIWIISIYTVLFAPVLEELLFRKFLCDRIVKYGQGITILLSGLMFGLFHGNFNQFFYAFFLGSFLAFLYVKTGNIKYTIGLHMMVNFIGSVVGGLFLQYVDLENLTPVSILYTLLYEVLIFGISIAGFVLLLVNMSKFRVYERFNPAEKDLRYKLALVNVGMILYYALFLALMIVEALFG